MPGAVLFVSKPLPLVYSSALVTELSVPMSFAKRPLAVVHFASNMREDAFAVGLTEVPITSVDSAIIELDPARSVTEATTPLTFIDRPAQFVSMLAVLQLDLTDLAEFLNVNSIIRQSFVVVGVFKVNSLCKLTSFVFFERNAFLLF